MCLRSFMIVGSLIVVVLLLDVGVSAAASTNNQEERRGLRRRTNPNTSPSPTSPTMIVNNPSISLVDTSRKEAFVLNLGLYNPESQEVTSLFEESLRELVQESGKQLSFPRSPTVAAEFDQGNDRLAILCVSILGDDVLKGLQVIDDPRRLRTGEEILPSSDLLGYQRDLRTRRREKPYYSEDDSIRRSRQPFSADNLLALMNSKASGFQISSLFGTDSGMCGNLRNPGAPTVEPSIAPSQDPTLSGSPTTELYSETPSILDSSVPSESPSNFASSTPSEPPSEPPSKLGSTVLSDPPSVSPSTLGSPIPSEPPSESPSVFGSSAPSEFPSQSPSVSKSLIPSTIPSLVPTNVPSVRDSDVPSISSQPSLPLPTVSLTPSVSNAPSLPPPDWEQFGNTIRGVTKQKIVFSNDGTVLGTIFTTCPSDDKPCARLYQNTNLGVWNVLGQDISAPTTSTSQVTDLSLAGNANRVAIVSVDMEADDVNLQTRRVQVVDFATTKSDSSNFQTVVGNTIIDSMEFDDSSTTNICLSSDGSLVTMSMGAKNVNLIQAWSIQSSGTWDKLGSVLNTTYADAAVEYSNDCRTVALVATDAQSLIYNLPATAAAWIKRDNGFPDTTFASLSFDGSGSKMAARSFSQTGLIDIYEFSRNSWQLTASIERGQVYESTFGYNLDLNSKGNTVAIATFRFEPKSTITCTQVFQYNTTHWEPLGRPPCLTSESGHGGFGAILELSGEGETMAVGDVGSFGLVPDRGHIHTYQFIERL